MTNPAELIRLGGEYERRGRFAAAWEALALGAEAQRPPDLPIWAGPGTPCERLLVRRKMRHLGAELRNARFLAAAARDVASVALVTEPRLLPLLARTLPMIRVIPLGDKEPAADCEASYERLALHYGRTHEQIQSSFLPLQPPETVRRGGLGIAWHSSNRRKDLPTLIDFARVLAGTNVSLQSLQYDEEVAGITDLEAAIGRQVARSPGDQKIDVDGFAALVASVDAVLTISNTTAHMAGSLGVPCVVVLDDLDHLTWPASADRSPFYPHLRLVRRNGRGWSSVLEEGMVVLNELLGQRTWNEGMRADHR